MIKLCKTNDKEKHLKCREKRYYIQMTDDSCADFPQEVCRAQWRTQY